MTPINILHSYFSLEVTTQDAVTPSFSISSALRDPDQLGPEVYEEIVGEEIYWTIDIPSKYICAFSFNMQLQTYVIYNRQRRQRK